ncbi:hypothetical protein NDU88_006045, partial [Pleurodeles waltl]
MASVFPTSLLTDLHDGSVAHEDSIKNLEVLGISLDKTCPTVATVSWLVCLETRSLHMLYYSSVATATRKRASSTQPRSREARVFVVLEDIMQNITPPPFFLALPGEPPIPWQKWKKVFLNYMHVCGSNLSSERKTSVLQHCLGAEGLEILETLPAITTSDGAEGDNSLNEFESTLLRLDKHFLPKVSIILQRYYFGKRKQTDDESIEDFVTALRKLASSCNFGENLEERIRDQFMLECKCDKVREALWAKNDPSLDEVLIIAKQVEHSMACIENLRKSRNVAMDVQALDTKTSNKFQANIRTRLM